MGVVRTRIGTGGQVVLAIGLAAIELHARGAADAGALRSFSIAPAAAASERCPFRPTRSRRTEHHPANSELCSSAAPKGPMLQSLPPPVAPSQAPCRAGFAAGTGRACAERAFWPRSSGHQWRLALAHFSGRAKWRAARLVKEDKGRNAHLRAPSRRLCCQRCVRARQCDQSRFAALRNAKEVLELPAGGLRIEGRVGDARIPHGQISFELYKGSQFEPGDKRPIARRL